MSRFFVDRPVFAIVIAIVIVILGAVAIPNLPIASYPEVVPPTVVVRAQYPGANPVTASGAVGPLDVRAQADQVLDEVRVRTPDRRGGLERRLRRSPMDATTSRSC